VLGQELPIFWTKAPAEALVNAPVFAGNPSLSFVGVAIACPARQSQVEEIIQALEDGFTDDGTIISAPSDNHGIQLLDEDFLAGRLIFPNDRAELSIVSFDRRATGFDEGFVATLRIVPTSRILAHLKPQEVKPCFATLWEKGMGNAGLCGMEFQAVGIAG
jgi:hypothetical protein